MASLCIESAKGVDGQPASRSDQHAGQAGLGRQAQDRVTLERPAIEQTELELHVHGEPRRPQRAADCVRRHVRGRPCPSYTTRCRAGRHPRRSTSPIGAVPGKSPVRDRDGRRQRRRPAAPGPRRKVAETKRLSSKARIARERARTAGAASQGMMCSLSEVSGAAVCRHRPVRGAASAMSTDAAPEPDEAEIAADLVRRIAAGDAGRRGGARRALQPRPPLPAAAPGRLRRSSADDLHQETFRIVLERLRRRGARRAGRARRLPPRHGAQPGRRRAAQDRPPPHRGGRRASWSRRSTRRRASSPPSCSTRRPETGAAADRRAADRPRPPAPAALLRRPRRTRRASAPTSASTSLHFNRVLFRARQRFKELLERSAAKQALGIA